jgi:hypothetical protein
MTAEHDHRQIPEWAQRERVLDQKWIAENLYVFEPAAQTAFAEQGRGALLVDTTVSPEGKGHPFKYASQAYIDEHGSEDDQRMVREYDPEREFVLVMLKPGDQVSTYRVRPRQSARGEGKAFLN